MPRSNNTPYIVDTQYLITALTAQKQVRRLRWVDVAEQLGMVRSAMEAFRAGRFIPGGHMLVTMAMWLGISDIREITMRRDGSPVPHHDNDTKED